MGFEKGLRNRDVVNRVLEKQVVGSMYDGLRHEYVVNITMLNILNNQLNTNISIKIFTINSIYTFYMHIMFKNIILYMCVYTLVN